MREPDRAWRALLASGATHVVVHEKAWLQGAGPGVSRTLEALGARRVLDREGDVLLELPRPPAGVRE